MFLDHSEHIKFFGWFHLLVPSDNATEKANIWNIAGFVSAQGRCKGLEGRVAEGGSRDVHNTCGVGCTTIQTHAITPYLFTTAFFLMLEWDEIWNIN